MDLWIRSQDKETLMIINTLCLAQDEPGTIIGYGIDGKIKVSIGKYATKERALEVLDEINRHIEEIYNCKYGIEYDLSSFTYEMPKE